MIKKGFLFLSLLSILIVSCGDPAIDPPISIVDGDLITGPVWVVVDEKNELLNYVSLNSHSITKLNDLASAPNDIEIDGQYAYVINSTSHNLYRFNLKTGGEPAVCAYNGQPNPYNLFIGSELIYVSLMAGNQVSVITKSGFRELIRVNLPGSGAPMGIAVDGQYIYVVNSDGYFADYANSRVDILSVSDYSYVTNIEVGDNPQAVSIDEAGNVYVTCAGLYNMTTCAYENGALFKIDPSSDFTKSALVSSVQLTAVECDSDKIYAVDANGFGGKGLYVYADDGAYVTNILADKYLKGLDIDGDKIYTCDGFTYSGPAYSYFIDKTDYSIITISNTGGGDAEIYCP